MQDEDGEWFLTTTHYCPEKYQVNHRCATRAEYMKDKMIGASLAIGFFLIIGSIVAGYFFCCAKGNLNDFARAPDARINEHQDP